MKARVIQTRFWDDEFVSSSTASTRYLYIYLLTSQYVNISGIFQLSDAKIKFETGLNNTLFENAKKELKDNKKVLFFGGWVFIVNAMKNNNYIKSCDNKIACKKELGNIPTEVKLEFETVLSRPVCTLVSRVVSTLPQNKKPQIRNKNKEIINKKLEYNKDELSNYLLEIGIEKEFALKEIIKFIDYWTEKDEKGKERWNEQKFFDIKKRLRTWIDRANSSFSNKDNKSTMLDLDAMREAKKKGE